MYRSASMVLVPAWLAAAPAEAQLTALGPEFLVNTYTSNLQIRPDVVSTGSGTFVIVWVSGNQASPSSSFDVFGQRYDASGNPLGTEFLVNTYTQGDQTRVAVNADAAGGFVVVWDSSLNHDGDDYGVFGRRYDADGDPIGTEFQVNGYTSGDQLDAAVGVAADGAFVVVWESADGQDGDLSGVFGRRFDAAGMPIGGDFQVNGYTSGYQSLPQVDVHDDGRFVVAWTGSGQDDPRTSYGAGVFARRFAADGSAAGTEFQLNQFTTGYQQSPDVAMHASGGFVVVWADFEQHARAGIFGRRYDGAGNAAGGEFVVHSYATADKEVPRVTADGGGGFVVAWTSNLQDGSSRGVFARRFGDSGAAQGPEFQVNTYTTNSQYRVSLSHDGDGSLVIAWQRRESTPIDDVYARRYAESGGPGGTCGDPVALVFGAVPPPARVVTASDALFVLRTAVGSESCEACVCDVNDSGSVTATDALTVLRAAVGSAADLLCPACG